MSGHIALARLLSSNSQWASDVESAEPGFFKESAKGQTPKILWFGCADSRVPESVVTGARPGDIFVHRNIANQFHPHDDSAASVLTYAVNHVGVEHVIVVGHTECGGAAACMAAAKNIGTGPVVTDPSLPADASLNKFLVPMTTLAASLNLGSLPPSEASIKLVEENVKVQVANICKSPIIQAAWKNGKSPKGKDVYVHGWVYDLGKGKLKDLGVSQGPGQ
ncbi:carbonic anhydrase [Flagelloscypha sp. PMI_526]|nr:carbonic anhydrase [Flagelloscypha sp. PMI_526]